MKKNIKTKIRLLRHNYSNVIIDYVQSVTALTACAFFVYDFEVKLIAVAATIIYITGKWKK